LREQGSAFDPEVVARLDIAYHAVLRQLGLVDREDGTTLTVARRIIDLAVHGERDPERLVATAVESLGSSHTATDRSDISSDGKGVLAELDQPIRFEEEAKRYADAAESKDAKAAWLRIAHGSLKDFTVANVERLGYLDELCKDNDKRVRARHNEVRWLA